MFNFFKRKGGKVDPSPESTRKHPTSKPSSVDPRSPSSEYDITNEKTGTIRKDVVNLLIPETDYSSARTGVGALLQIMAGKRKRGKRKRDCKVPNDETQAKRSEVTDAAPPTPAKNTQDELQSSDDPADFVKALVLQKYAKPDPKQHVSLIYVSNDQELQEKRHAEALLREIAKSIDCNIDLDEEQMGTTDSKDIKEKKDKKEPVYETLDTKSIREYKNDLKGELTKLLEVNNTEINNDLEIPESPNRKSNLKPPRSDNEGCSDDDRSDNGKKRVTFRKHIIFDDGEQQTDEEADSSFESLTSEEADYLEDLPDNDEMLGGYIVSQKNTTVINLNEPIIKVECVDDLRTITNENSDSGFIECDRNESGDETSDVKSIVEECEESGESGGESEEESEEDEVIEEIIETIDEIETIEESDTETADDEEETEVVTDDVKKLVNQESRFQSQVATLTELADSRCGEAETARELIVACRKEIEEKEQQIERGRWMQTSQYQDLWMSMQETLVQQKTSFELKRDLAAAYKESELVRQRGRSLEEELAAARQCSARLADDLQARIDEAVRHLRSELDDAISRRAALEARVQVLERDKERLEQEKLLQEQKAKETLEVAEENTAKWRAAHEAARSQAAARAERMLADCEWKMRELEKRARDAEKEKKELTETVQQLQAAPPTPSHVAELKQLRGLASEQQRSIQSLTLQIQKIETREEALKLEVHRLKDLLEKEARIQKDKEEQHLQAIERLEQQHSDKISALKAEHAEAAANAASARAALERAQAERTRTALTQLRAEAEKDARNADRKLRELTTRVSTADSCEAAANAASARAALERAQAERTRTALTQLRAEAEKDARNADRKLRELTTRVSTADSCEAAANAASARAALERAQAERTRTALTQLRAEAEKDARNADRKLRELTTRVSTADSCEAAANAASARAALERAQAERTRTALTQLRAEAEKDARNADRKLRELTTRFENLKEVLASKESQFEHALAEAHSKADWDIMQLRHLLDKADIAYANNIESLNERFEREKEQLINEWSEKVREVEEQAATAATEAKKVLEATRMKLIAEKNEVMNKLKEKHQQEVENQWEYFMSDKETCLERMKAECRQEGEEERLKREKELLEEIAELKSQIHSKTTDYEQLSTKAAACGRELDVTEQELREALAREKELREKRSEDANKIKQLGRANQEQIEHLTRKCACLRKLFDDMRARLAARERSAEQEARARDKELHQLRAEVARLTKILVEQSSPKLGARTRADGCETSSQEESFFCKSAPRACETQPSAPRRKGGTLRTPEPIRKRLTLPELPPLPPEARRNNTEYENGRRRAKSVDLPAVQVPVRIRQLEQKTKE